MSIASCDRPTMSFSEPNTVDISRSLRARRSIRTWAGVILIVGMIQAVGLIHAAGGAEEWKKVETWVLLATAPLMVLVGIAARRGVKWGVAIVTAIVVLGLISIFVWLCVQPTNLPNQNPGAGIAMIALVSTWLGW